MRHHLMMLLVGIVTLVSAGCGFHLRDTTKIPSELKTLHLDSYDPYGPLTRTIQDQLRSNGVMISSDALRKDIPSLRIVTSSISQDTVSIFRDGVTAEYQLVLEVQAQILVPGHDLTPISARVLRSFFSNPLTALAKDSEQNIILQEMRAQVAQQLVRKLLTVDTSAMKKEGKSGELNGDSLKTTPVSGVSATLAP